MKKVVSLLLVAVLLFTLSLPCFALSGIVVDFSISTCLSFVSDSISSYRDSIQKRTEAARGAYFNLIVEDKLCSGLTIFDSTGQKFTDDILSFYFEQYWEAVTGTSDYYDSNYDVFISASGFPDTPFSYRLLSFYSSQAAQSDYFDDNDVKNITFSNFKNYYNTFLARYLLQQGQSATDPNPGKSGLDIAPGYVSSEELIEGIEKDNSYYTPKGEYSKISYRTDVNYQRYISSSSNPNNAFCYFPLILDNSSFVGTNDSQKMYFTMFADVDGEKYYSEYQFCVWFDNQEVLDDNGNFQSYNKILNLKVWSVLDGSEESSTTVYTSSYDFSPYKYMILVNDPGSSYCFYAYKNYSYYLADSSRYSFGNSISKYDKLYSPDLTSSDDYTNFWYNSTTQHRFKGSYGFHDSDCCYGGNCDLGLLVDSKPIEFTWRDIDTTKIPSNQIITINGDTIYNYNITNPETGDSNKFGDYITNNYTYITNNYGGNQSGGSGSGVGGNVTVGGSIDVGGSVGVDINFSVPDININVNGNGGAGESGSISNPDDFTSADNVDLNKYYDTAVEQSTGFQKFLKDFFGFLPVELLGLILFAVSMAIICRVFGR